MDDAVQVLYVERDLEFARKTAEQFEQVNSQLEVTTVLGSRPAFQALSNDEYDCIVSEYRLPNSTGLELFDQIRRNYPNLPFILFTEHGSESIAGDAVTAGISDYLQKAEADDDYELLADSISNAVTANETVIEATQERRRLEQVLKTVPSCVVQLNRDGQFVFANDRAETVLGLKQAELEERAYNDPEWDIKDLDGNPIPDDELPFARVLYEGEQVRDQHTIRWPDGKKRVLAVNGAPVMNEGSVESVVCSLTDITDRYRRERRLEKLHEATHELYDAKTKQEVAQITSDTADAILDFELNGVHFYDEQAGGLKPVAVSDRTQRVTDELVTFDHGIAWEAFQSGEIRQYDDIHTADNIYNPESEFRSGLYLPLGEYGILLANSTQRGDFDDSDVSLGQLLAENAKSALDRVERERRLALLQERTSALMQTTTADKTVDLTVGAAAEILGTNLSGFIQEDEREEVLRPLSTTDALAAEFSTYEGSYAPSLRPTHSQRNSARTKVLNMAQMVTLLVHFCGMCTTQAHQNMWATRATTQRSHLISRSAVRYCIHWSRTDSSCLQLKRQTRLIGQISDSAGFLLRHLRQRWSVSTEKDSSVTRHRSLRDRTSSLRSSHRLSHMISGIHCRSYEGHLMAFAKRLMSTILTGAIGHLTGWRHSLMMCSCSPKRDN